MATTSKSDKDRCITAKIIKHEETIGEQKEKHELLDKKVILPNDSWLGNDTDNSPCKIYYVQVPNNAVSQAVIYSKLDATQPRLTITPEKSMPDMNSLSFVQFSTENINCCDFIVMAQQTSDKISSYSASHDCKTMTESEKYVTLEMMENKTKSSYSSTHVGCKISSETAKDVPLEINESGNCQKKENLLPNDEDGLSCRICHSDQEPLVSPCLCTGSMKYVHEACLMNWLKSSVKTNCELCLHKVRVKKSLKPLNKWQRPVEKPIAIIWLFTFIVALTLNVISITKDASRQCKATACIIYYILGSVGAILGMIFLAFWAVKCVAFLKKWLTFNQVWKLEEKYYKKKTITPPKTDV